MITRIAMLKWVGAFVPIFLFGSCANVSYLSNQTSLAVSAETASNPAQPVSLLFGFDRRSLAAVPPEEPALVPTGVHRGDILSSVGIFEVRPTRYLNKDSKEEAPKPWDITVSSFSITGKAAEDATKLSSDTKAGNAPTAAASKYLQDIVTIKKDALSPLRKR